MFHIEIEDARNGLSDSKGVQQEDLSEFSSISFEVEEPSKSMELNHGFKSVELIHGCKSSHSDTSQPKAVFFRDVITERNQKYDEIIARDFQEEKFKINSISLSFCDEETKNKFECYTIMHQDWFTLLVGLAVPIYVILVEYLILDVIRWVHNGIPTVYFVVGIILLAAVALFVGYYANLTRTYLRGVQERPDMQTFRHLQDIAKSSQTPFDAADDDLFGDHLANQPDECHVQRAVVSRIYTLALLTELCLLTTLEYHAIILTLFYECNKGCMTNVPMHSTIWIAIWYVPMHAAVVVPKAWWAILATDIYSKALLCVLFYVYGGSSVFLENWQVVFNLGLLWAISLTALHFHCSYRMRTFIHRERALILLAKEQHELLHRNLLWAL